MDHSTARAHAPDRTRPRSTAKHSAEHLTRPCRPKSWTRCAGTSERLPGWRRRPGRALLPRPDRIRRSTLPRAVPALADGRRARARCRDVAASWSTSSRVASGCSSARFFRIRTCISSPWSARHDARAEVEGDQKRLTEDGRGECLLLVSQVSRRGRRSRCRAVSRSAAASGEQAVACAASCRGVSRRRAPPGRAASCAARPVPEMRQPWRERPPSSARSLTLGAPPGVVHATAARCQCPAKRHAITPPIPYVPPHCIAARARA